MLRSYRTNPSLSSHAAINGNFDFNATPLAPPGTKVLIHGEASNRPSFSTHAVDGWYIGPSPNHYLCYHCYIPSTASTRHANTVEFFFVVKDVESGSRVVLLEMSVARYPDFGDFQGLPVLQKVGVDGVGVVVV